MPKRGEHLSELDPVEHPDAPPPAEPVREALKQRLSELPPWHPSSPHTDSPRSGDDASGETFWEQVPRLEALRAEHFARWPDKNTDKAAHPDDPPGSWRGRGDQYLNPEENARTESVIADLQRPEKQITAVLQQIEQDNTHGGVLVGLKHCLKGQDRLKEKIITRAEGDLRGSLAEVADGIRDAVRYTFSFASGHYVSGYFDVCERLESAGYRMIETPRNRWRDDAEYNGINTCWQATSGGKFELQFHTPESFYAKEELTHDSYDRLRAPDTSWQELPELSAYQRLVTSAVPKPAGVDRMDLSREGS